ncbi:uncharacterized protein LOC105398002 isoform X1 [Plutella xylostella]|uniref:uncharacterized protein LOC105398002 isoform X1 n=1 Tax=Plutella xylostella TaxID=51655 RepID=UPI00203248CD|nr:uncharacterized protein LOC105398002 isoform X1 [Plutella xylostella]
MAVAAIVPVLLLASITRSTCEPTFNFHQNNGKSNTQFGGILKPPPPPHASSLVPVPFHKGGGSGNRFQRQNHNEGYHYAPPSSLAQPGQNFKFPAPFYKQYNFNFVPPPQPFTTTPSPTLFQKVSTWLFPSQQTSNDAAVNIGGQAASKKECNPCNSMPWIPVIRYDLGAKNLQQQNIQPTYGAPSPTAVAGQFSPHPFQRLPQLSTGVPHETYGPPAQQHVSNSIDTPSSTYGPPSATANIGVVASHSPPSSTYGVPSSSYSIPSSSYSIPSSSYGVPSSSFSAPSSSYRVPSSTYGVPSSSFGVSSSSVGVSSQSNGEPSSTYGTPSSTYGPPSSSFVPSQTFGLSSSATPGYDDVPSYQAPNNNDIDAFGLTAPGNDFQLPKLSNPTGFKNSYGEPIGNSFLDLPYPVSAAAESFKIKTEILPNGQKPDAQNTSFALAKPAPFTRGRNIHTLQPVALPNLSVSPLPPIFNARPFRTVPSSTYLANNVQGINNMHQSNQVSISQSVPIAEFSQADYPPTIIQSPIIDISVKSGNQSKAYRNIVNSYVIDQNRDISSQASEDHIASTKTNNIQDVSFESTGVDVGNDLYDIPADLKQNKEIPSNHKENFADLRGVPDRDVDKYRTENNLQSIDSPLLYLKPSAPHKEYEHFLLAVSTPTYNRDYEIYDEVQTTTSPNHNFNSDTKNDYGNGLSPPPIGQEDANKPKIVQIIIPYTTGKGGNKPSGLDFEQTGYGGAEWASASEDEYQARKVPGNTENYYGVSTVTDNYNTETTTTETEVPTLSGNEYYESDQYNTHAILNDLYDVKEPPFDIIKLQHNIDDWTEQQYSQHQRPTQKARPSGKYAHAKQIPDEYFTTVSPFSNYVTVLNDEYDHEGEGSAQKQTVTDAENSTNPTPFRYYNVIQRGREKTTSGKNTIASDVKPHIYTAASSFRQTTTTPAPWGHIETSISPLTKEKVYVVTSKPWRDSRNATGWSGGENFESMKTENTDNDVSASDNLPFKSPRFLNRPSFGATASGDTVKAEAYGYPEDWHHINDLEARQSSQNATATLPEGPQSTVTTNMDEGQIDTTTAGPST